MRPTLIGFAIASATLPLISPTLDASLEDSLNRRKIASFEIAVRAGDSGIKAEAIIADYVKLFPLRRLNGAFSARQMDLQTSLGHSPRLI